MITEEHISTVRAASGGSNSGDGAPNGMNAVGALNVIQKCAEEAYEHDVDISELGPRDRQQYENAWEDLAYWYETLAMLFGEEIDAADGVALTFTETKTVEDEDGNDVEQTTEVTKTFANPLNNE